MVNMYVHFIYFSNVENELSVVCEVYYTHIEVSSQATVVTELQTYIAAEGGISISGSMVQVTSSISLEVEVRVGTTISGKSLLCWEIYSNVKC